MVNKVSAIKENIKTIVSWEEDDEFNEIAQFTENLN